jgi:hypothetical protein
LNPRPLLLACRGMSKLPHVHQPGRTLSVKLPSDVSAKLATYRREMHPTYSDEAVAAYLIRDALIGLGLLDLPGKDRGKAAGGK